MKTINVTVVSAEKELYSGVATFFAATAATGEIGVYPGHVPTLAQLKAGQVRLTLENGKEEVFWISGGLLEVQPQEIIVLADCAERAKDLDAAAVQKAQEEARKAIASGGQSLDIEKALIELTLAQSQLDAVNRLKSF
ncbi:F0F1 ATP synthase subunit epsilon [Ignatzschineria ureiclastica]|uniref:ATP synthase epsilon chain n=1 Tax=Ignatzschineria ureiclastica TaxID=472582 RepID=A0A2U2AF55_9GAMM|nr:F0F1 ATP synthase subunit epsilon [Ignatzschineria ureiclastica]PWD81298.1 F0F1 ATP synthase subunit epsilon [Ignatzschineria ureiclastica]GGZ97862.1 ATP synthase epsilon chain [Ignatzschineria ureiclastica]